MIGKEKAIEIYFGSQKKAGETIERISRWDESKTCKENALDIGIGYQVAFEISKHYNLKFKR